MAEIIWTDRAITSLDEIAEYIHQDSPEYAKKFVSQVYKKVTALKLHPRMGRMVPEKQNDSLRELLIQSYRIIYHIETTSEKIYIQFILHQRRSFES